MSVSPSPDVDSVIATFELDRRPSRRPDREAENHALVELAMALAKSPENFFGELVAAALRLSRAGSTGISLLNEEVGRFVWPAVAGRLRSHIGSGTPSNFGPCGTVLERDSSLLFQRPERHFPYLAPIDPPLEEVLLIPFHVDGKAVGTIWAVSHDKSFRFDSEDRRILEALSAFAASAYRVLQDSGALEPLLKPRASDL